MSDATQTTKEISAWQPVVPLAQAAPDQVDQAIKRRTVLLSFLERRDYWDSVGQVEFQQAGISAYRRVFGVAISGCGFRKLYARTIERDGGCGDWQRIEIYLDQKRGASSKVSGNQCDHSALAHRLQLKDPDAPTLTERQNALEYSFVHFEELAASNPGQADAVKRSVLKYLWDSAPWLAYSPDALKRAWNRKYDRWKESGRIPSAIRDQRTAARPSPHIQDLKHDLDLIASEAWHHDGKLALAIRKLRRDGKLSQAFTDRYTLNVRRDKSYVARSIRNEITAYLEGTLAYRRSQWQANMEGPRISRSHDYQPGDYFAADDVHFNIVSWFLDDHGQPDVSRCECLVWFDCRSLYPLGYVLTPGRYTGETIRRGKLNVHDKFGIPHRGFLYEWGIWASRFAVGNPGDFLGWDEYEMGLRERGVNIEVEVRHAHTPQGKLIEGLFNILQQNQRCEPGFVGFNEREYRQEELQKFKGRVKRGLVHPSEKFHSIDQWRAILDGYFEQYMHEPQNGKLLQGMSPAEKFAECAPLRKLPDNARYLLSTHRVRKRVKSNGLTVTIRGKQHTFYNEEIGRFIGREVLAHYNIEQPDLLTVCDREMKNYFTVKRHELPAFDATDDQLKQANRDRYGFMRTAKLRVDAIRHPVRKSVVRDNVIDADSQALGSHIRIETEQFEAEKTRKTTQLRKAHRIAAENNISIPANIKNPDRVRKAVEGEIEWREKQSMGAEAAATSKNYILKPSAAAVPTVGFYWSLWAKIEKANPGLNRHSLTQRAIGCHPTPKDMTPGQLSKMIDAFSAILRDLSKAAA